MKKAKPNTSQNVSQHQIDQRLCVWVKMLFCIILVHATWSWLDTTELKHCVGIRFAAKCLESAVLTKNGY